MDDEEKKFVNGEKEEGEENGGELAEKKNGDRKTKAGTGYIKILLIILFFPFKVLFRGIQKYPKMFLVLFLIFAAVAGTVYVARTRPEMLGITARQDVTEPQKEVENLVAEISKVIKLPENETPTIATVTDASKLSDQAFFASAQNGDKVLIYSNSKKIYLYRPSEKRIIEASIINITQKEAVVTETPPSGISPTPTGI